MAQRKSWRTWLGMGGKRDARNSRRPKIRRIGLEPLEMRTLLSAGGLLGTEVSFEPLADPSDSAEVSEDTKLTFPGFRVFQGEQARAEEQITALLASGKKLDDPSSLKSVSMPEWFLRDLVNAHGAAKVANALGKDGLEGLFGDAADSVLAAASGGTPTPMLLDSGDFIGMDDFRTDYPGIDGSGFAVVVIDLGFDLDHPAFGPSTDGVADRIVYQYDFAEDDADATYYSSAYAQWDHGTHVAGIVGSENAIFTGMAPGVDLITLKVADDSGVATLDYMADALEWVADNVWEYQIVAVNMSVGDAGMHMGETTSDEVTNPPSSDISDALAKLADLGVIVVGASGNGNVAPPPVGPPAMGISYPAADPNCLAVGAVYDDNYGPMGPYQTGGIAYSTAADRIAPYSQRGGVGVYAPGSVIISAYPGGNYYIAGEGTSAAAPHISGIAALVQQLAVEELGRRVTPAEFLDLLEDTGESISDGDDEDDNVYNGGATRPRVDMLALADELTDSTGVYSYSTLANGVADTFELDRSGSNLIVTLNDSVLATLPVANVKQITLNGSITDADTFVVTNLGDFDGAVVLNAGSQYSLLDDVSIDDTAGDDFFMVEKDYAVFSMEDAYTVTANDSWIVHGYARNDGDDRAFMGGTSDGASNGNNRLKTHENSANVARLWMNNIYHRAKFFDAVEVDGRGGGNMAYVFATANEDDFTATKNEGRHVSTASGTDYSYESFATVWAYSSIGVASTDTASLTDSPMNDMVWFRPEKTEMKNYNGTDNYEIVLRYFNEVFADGTAHGGSDRAIMHDVDNVNSPQTTDLLIATMEAGKVRAKYYYDPDDYYNPTAVELHYHALGFELTRGISYFGPDKKDADTVTPASLMAWDGSWDEI